MLLLQPQPESQEMMICETIVLGYIRVMVIEGNTSLRICPYSVKGLPEDFIRKNLPDRVVYDPSYKCTVNSCPYHGE